MRAYGWCHNGYHTRSASEVARRARLAELDALIIKYGDPAFERAMTDEGIAWGTERFTYAAQPVREAMMLADAVDAGAAFAVANCEPNDGAGWELPAAPAAIRTLIDTFRARHSRVPLWICADLRHGRSLDAPFVREAARAGVDGWMPMVYPRAFGQSVAVAFNAAYPGATYLGLPCAPVTQTYDNVGPALVREQFEEAVRRRATLVSIYVVETASDDELRAVGAGKKKNPENNQSVLREVHHAYIRGAISILDHGTPAELRSWAELFGGNDKTTG